MTMEHHFRIDVFTAVIDFQLQELKKIFCDHAVELLILSVALSPQDAYKSFKIDDICNSVEMFYPQDFIEEEKNHFEVMSTKYCIFGPLDLH
jgi:hypothetical protein